MIEPSNTVAATLDGSSAAEGETPPAPAKVFARSSTWALVNYGAAQVIRLGSNLVLWRLLTPVAFGQMALVNTLIVGLAMFSDIGIGQGIVQHERGEDPTFLNTVWTLQVGRGLILAVVAALAGIPMARFYNEPELARLIPVVAIGTALSAFNSTNLFTASRRMLIARQTVIDAASQVGSVAVMIAWAYVTHSVWALAGGAAVSSVIRLVLSHLAMPGVRNRFRWDPATLKSISHFGRWVFVSTVLTFFSSYSDRLVFGKLISVQMLGTYSIAAVWSTFPMYIVDHLIGSVLFPLFSRVKGKELGALFSKLRGNVLTASGWLVSCLIAGGPTLIRFLYDKRAVDAGSIVQLLAIGTWFSTLESANGAVVLSLGKPKWLAVANAAKLVAMLVLMPIGAKLFGFKMAVLALSITEIVRYAVSVRACFQAGLRPLRQDAALSAGVALSAIIGFGVRSLYRGAHLPIAGTRLDAFLEGAVICLVLTTFWWRVFAFQRRQPAGAGVAVEGPGPIADS